MGNVGKFSEPNSTLNRDAVHEPPIENGNEPNKSGYLHTLTPEQRTKLYKLWEMVLRYFKLPYKVTSPAERTKTADELAQTQGSVDFRDIKNNPILKEFFLQTATDDPDTMVLRFLRARKWDLNASFCMIAECSEWRHEFNVHKLLMDGERRIKPELMECGKGFIWGEDKEGRVVAYIRAGLHDKYAQSLGESIDFTIYWMEIGRRLRRFDEQLVTVVVDLAGTGLKSFDLPYAQFMIKCLQSYYPEILGKCLLVNAPFVFGGFWKVIRKLLDPVVASKFIFVEMDHLQEYIDPDQIPADFGGKSAFYYNFHYREHSKSKRHPCHEVDPSLREKVEQYKGIFVDLTFKVQKLLNSNDQRELPNIMSERDKVKNQLRIGHNLLTDPLYPDTLYHRLGVFDDNGRANWKRCKKIPCESGRASAPPPLTVHSLKSPSHSSNAKGVAHDDDDENESIL